MTQTTIASAAPIQTITAAALPAIGQPLAGGTFFARHFIGDQLFAMVYLDQASEFTAEWGEFGKKIEGADSFVDGLANTQAMLAAECQAVLELDHAAGDYLPAYVEQSLLLAYLKAHGLTELDRDWYWSSTQRSANSAFLMTFDVGLQLNHGKVTEFRVRPVRRLLIQ